MNRLRKSMVHVRIFLRKTLAVLNTLLFKNQTRRWARVATQGPPAWDARNQLIATFITPGSAVLDLGCGAMSLESHLPRACTYVPCDLIPSAPHVIKCDFNAGRYPSLERTFDVVVCSGVLEYIRDTDTFLRRISTLGVAVILTYNTLRPTQSRFDRLANNWVNHFSREQLEQAFAQAGMHARLLAVRNENEHVFELRRVEQLPVAGTRSAVTA